MSRKSMIQDEIFQAIKEKLPSDVSLAFEISNLLGISQDCAYRRIRGEKSLTVDELYILKEFFELSLDQFGVDQM